MGDLSEHFSRCEIACNGDHCCGGSSPVTESLVSGLEDLRLGLVRMYPDVKISIMISSGFRCGTHNNEVGGSRDSLHCRGMAADIVVRGLTPTEVAAVAKQVAVFRDGGIGVYKCWVHVDVRKDGPARW